MTGGGTVLPRPGAIAGAAILHSTAAGISVAYFVVPNLICERLSIASLGRMRLALITAPLVALAAVVVALAAPAFAQEPTVTITIKDHQFVPGEVPIPAGVRVELTIRNEQATPVEFESASLHREKVVPPGGSASVFVGPLQPGRYEFFDDFHPASRGFLVVR